MAPKPDEFSTPGSVNYDSDTLSVGDGTWDFTKNTFLLPNLQGTNFETTRYNGMGNRFSTLDQYHKMILAHGILAAIVFLFLIPAAVMIVRFYDGRPGWAVRYHARLQIFSSLLILVIFILGFLSVGPNRALTNPHHGIGVAIFVLFILQFIGGAMIRSITKARSLRVTLHQWSGRAIALLGITQIPLGLALYGAPLYLFILYAVWMAILLLIYFILNFRSGMRREYLRQGPPPSEAGHTRVTDSEYFASEHKSSGGGNKLKWLGGLAAAGGLWALVRNRGKNKDRDMERGRSPSLSSISRGRGPEVVASRRGSASYLSDEKFSDLPTQKKSGGGFMKVLGGAAAAVGAGGLVSGFMNRRNSGRQRHNDDYSAVSTETPRRAARPGRGFPQSDITSDYTEDISRRDPTATSLLSPTGPTVMAGAISAADSRHGSRDPVTPSRPTRARGFTGGRRGDIEESDYSSYVSPSRRVYDDEPRSGGGGVAKGIMAGLGLGWFGKKMADRKARKEDDRRAREEEQRMRDEEDMRSGITGSRYTGDGHPSPTRKPSRRPPPRRQTGIPPSQVTATEMTESSIDERPPGGIRQVHEPAPKRRSRSHSRSQSHLTSVVMPATTVDPSDVESSYVSTARPASRRRDGDKASTEAAARAASLAATERERYGSPHSQPVSLKLRMHDDRDRNVTLRRLTEEEAREARRSRSHSRADSEVSASDMGSSGYGRGGYRRDSSQRRAEAAAEKKVEAAVAEGDDLGGPPRPAFNKGRPTKPAKDSAYYSGPAPSIPPPPAAQAPLAPSAPPSSHAGPSGMSIAAGQTMSSLASESHGTWSQMTPSPEDKKAESRRNRRRLERRRGSSAARPTGADMYD